MINYSRVNWVNGEAGATPMNATNLNNMDYAIYQIDQALKKLSADEVGNLVMAAAFSTSGNIMSGNRVIAGTTGSTLDGVPGCIMDKGGSIALKAESNPFLDFYPNRATTNPKRLMVSSGGFSFNANVTVTGSGVFSGALSTYGFTVPRIQRGSASVELESNTWKTLRVQFPKAFTSTPMVVPIPRHNSQITNLVCKMMTVTSTEFTVGFYCSGAGTYAVDWVAML